ncbi:MAG: helix-turn-helix transcriptional regulator, partial [Pseudomonadota bacterium]
MANSSNNPAAVRQVFGDNLRLLTRRYKSVSGVCRELGVNRTQFNRYLAGESFPRPDVLQQICSFFDVDAR